MTRRSIGGVADHLEKRSARLSFLQAKDPAKFTIHHPNPAPIIHHDEAIEHRAEDRLNAEFAFAKAFFQLALAIGQVLERESDAPCLRIAADQKFSRRPLLDNGLGQLFHILPGSNPSAPDDQRRHQHDRDKPAKGKPAHERSAFPDAITETAHGLDARRRLCRVSCAAGARAYRPCEYRSRFRNPRLH